MMGSYVSEASDDAAGVCTARRSAHSADKPPARCTNALQPAQIQWADSCQACLHTDAACAWLSGMASCACCVCRQTAQRCCALAPCAEISCVGWSAAGACIRRQACMLLLSQSAPMQASKAMSHDGGSSAAPSSSPGTPASPSLLCRSPTNGFVGPAGQGIRPTQACSGPFASGAACSPAGAMSAGTVPGGTPPARLEGSACGCRQLTGPASGSGRPQGPGSQRHGRGRHRERGGQL